MKRPPYAKQLSELCANPDHWQTLPRAFTVHVLCGSLAWQEAQKAIRAGWGFVLLPPAANPEEYEWSVCAGHDPALICVHGSIPEPVLLRLGNALIRDGVRSALTVGDFRCLRFIAEDFDQEAACQ